jgi:hypothetical protein
VKLQQLSLKPLYFKGQTIEGSVGYGRMDEG